MKEMKLYLVALFFFIAFSAANGSDCEKPYNVKEDPISNTSVKLSWSAGSSANGYLLRVKEGDDNPYDFDLEITVYTKYYVVTGLHPGQHYEYRLRALCGDDHSNWTEDKYFKTPGVDHNSANCNTPSNLKISNITGTGATVSWSGVEGAQNYEVEVEDGDNTPPFNFNQVTSMTSITVTGLTPGGQYKAKVKSKCSDDNSEYTEWVFFIAGQGQGGQPDSTGVDTTGTSGSCPVPVGLAISNTTGTSATVSWSAVNEAQNYEVEVEDGDNTPPFNFNQVTSMTSITVTGLTPGGQYKAKVKSKCSDDNSEYTEWVFFIAGQGQGGQPDSTGVDTTGASASCRVPAGLLVFDITANSANVSWSPVEGVTLFEVEVEEEEDTPDYVFNLTTNQTSIAIVGLVEGGTYKVKVKSKCQDDNSEYTEWVFFSTGQGGQPDSTAVDTTGAFCAIPMNLAASEITTTSVRISWSSVPGVEAYEIEVEDDENTPSFEFNAITQDTSIIITGLSAGGEYQAKVKSKCNNINSQYSNWIFFTSKLIELRAPSESEQKNDLLRQLQEIKVFPNPANYEFRIALPDFSEDLIKVSVHLMDSRGQEIWKRIDAEASDFPLNIPAKNLQNGLYQLILRTNLGVQMHKIIITH